MDLNSVANTITYLTGTEVNEFKEFPKLYRLNREWVASEKMDGTNSCVVIADDGVSISAQSRTRKITPESDNYGFARWVQQNKDELLKLGPGYHFGEWIGQGIQRGYGLKEKRFYLFNTSRWSDSTARPSCCHVVPVLAQGTDVKYVEQLAFEKLLNGSVAVPGYGKPEGIVLFHEQSNYLFKVTLDGDGHKGQRAS